MSGIKNMSGMFDGSKAFNMPIGAWDVSNVNEMMEMFRDAPLFNQPVGQWDVRNVTRCLKIPLSSQEP